MIFLDFEASGMMGFPIEVGFAVVDADRAIRSDSRIIRNDEWLDDFSQWDPNAEAIHGITRSNIMEFGISPAATVDWLEAAIGGLIACVDSHYDKLWMSALVAEARGRDAKVNFGLADITAAFEGVEIDELRYDRLAQQVSDPIRYGREFARRAGQCDKLGLRPKVHRAAADAEHLASWYTASLRDDATVQRLLFKSDGGYMRLPLGQALNQDQIDEVLGNVVGQTAPLTEAEREAGKLALEDLLATIRRLP
jgi:hypothetical protein